MKSYLFFLLTITMVTAAPTASDEQRLHRVILEEIIQNVNNLDGSLSKEAKEKFVQQEITIERCSVESFCIAGKVLEELKAEDLGLQDKDWILPRMLVAYSRKIKCPEKTSEYKTQLQDVLQEIKKCSKKIYAKH